MNTNRIFIILAMLMAVFSLSAQTHTITRSGAQKKQSTAVTTKKQNSTTPSAKKKTGAATQKRSSTNQNQQTARRAEEPRRDGASRQSSVIAEEPRRDGASRLSPVIQNLINNMVYVSGGTFTMGATSEQGSDAFDSEKPAHQVTLSAFSIGRYEVTQEEWEAVMGNNPSHFKGAKRPVEQVSWEDCQTFIRKLNAMTGKNFRLPTEAEWEYAARGGNSSRGYKYAGSHDIGSVAWYDGNSGNQTHNVGTKQPNELGLYDMSGNVWERCLTTDTASFVT